MNRLFLILKLKIRHYYNLILLEEKAILKLWTDFLEMRCVPGIVTLYIIAYLFKIFLFFLLLGNQSQITFERFKELTSFSFIFELHNFEFYQIFSIILLILIIKTPYIINKMIDKPKKKHLIK